MAVTNKPAGRGVLKTLLGISRTAERKTPPEHSTVPEPPTSSVPDSFGVVAKQCLDLRDRVADLERRLRVSEEERVQAVHGLATAQVVREQAIYDLERERAAHAQTAAELEKNRASVVQIEHALDALAKGSSDEALNYFRGRVFDQSGRIRDLERHVRQNLDSDALQELHRTLNQHAGALVSVIAAFERITGKNILDASELLALVDSKDCQLISAALSARVKNPTQN